MDGDVKTKMLVNGKWEMIPVEDYRRLKSQVAKNAMPGFRLLTDGSIVQLSSIDMIRCGQTGSKKTK